MQGWGAGGGGSQAQGQQEPVEFEAAVGPGVGGPWGKLRLAQPDQQRDHQLLQPLGRKGQGDGPSAAAAETPFPKSSHAELLRVLGRPERASLEWQGVSEHVQRASRPSIRALSSLGTGLPTQPVLPSQTPHLGTAEAVTPPPPRSQGNRLAHRVELLLHEAAGEEDGPAQAWKRESFCLGCPGPDVGKLPAPFRKAKKVTGKRGGKGALPAPPHHHRRPLGSAY